MEPENANVYTGATLQEYLAILRRRRAVILQAFVLISVVGIVITLMTKPVYQAQAKLLIDPPAYTMSTIDANNPLSSLFAANQEQSVATQVEVLQTGPLIDQAIKDTGPAVLNIQPLKDTNIIEVDSEANDPKTAAAAPNALLDTYIAQSQQQNSDDLDNAFKFVKQQEQVTAKELAKAENDLKNFKLKNHLPELATNKTDQVQHVIELTHTYETTQDSLNSVEAQIALNQQAMAAEPKALASTSATTNVQISNIKASIASLQLQRVSLTQKGGFTAKSPQIITIDAQIADLKKQLAQQPALTPTETVTPNAAVQGFHATLVNLKVQAGTLKAQLAQQQKDLAAAQAQVGKIPDWEFQGDKLTRARDGALATHAMFANQLADLNLRDKARHSNMHLIQRAEIPLAPVRPKKLQGAFFACLIGLFVGICLALVQEFLDDRINTIEDADRVLALPSLGHVPALSATDARLLPQMRSMDPASESYRILRTNLHFASVDAPLRTLLVTSASPGEGKTTTAANLAFAMALDGKRVILVDTDLRRPSLHKLLELPTVPGLTDVLLGEAKLEDVLLEHQEMPGLCALTAGSTPPNPAELLNSRKFRNVVDQLTGQADIVIFDSSPLLVGADSQILASQMDGTVLVVETGETKKTTARQALALLRQARANVLGVAHNKLKTLNGQGYYYYHYSAPGLDSKTTKGVQKALLAAMEDDE